MVLNYAFVIYKSGFKQMKLIFFPYLKCKKLHYKTRMILICRTLLVISLLVKLWRKSERMVNFLAVGNEVYEIIFLH